MSLAKASLLANWARSLQSALRLGSSGPTCGHTAAAASETENVLAEHPSWPTALDVHRVHYVLGRQGQPVAVQQQQQQYNSSRDDVLQRLKVSLLASCTRSLESALCLRSSGATYSNTAAAAAEAVVEHVLGKGTSLGQLY